MKLSLVARRAVAASSKDSAHPARRILGQSLRISVAAIALLGLVGCTTNPATPSPSYTSASPSASKAHTLLTTPGAARTAVNALIAAAGSDNVVKVDISRQEASLSIVRDGEPLTWSYQDGVVTPADSDIADVQQTSFNPNNFRFDNLGAMFSAAANISGSDTNQQLQIVEYNQGQVLMTVTTNPESSTVFFRSDGTVVSALDFATSAGISEALRDCVGTATEVIKVGYKPDTGIYADVVGAQPGTVVEATRPSALPRWSATFKASAGTPFDPSLVRAEVIASIIKQLETQTTSAPASSKSIPQPDLTWVIERQEPDAEPTLRINVDGQTHSFTLAGEPLAN